MIDEKYLVFVAGAGGDGRVYFRREKYVPKGGPNGGDGGRGGNIILRADKNLTTLAHLAGKTKFVAQPGADGGRQKKFGASGADVVVNLPLGTEISIVSQNKIAQRRWRQRHGYQLPLLRKKQVRLEVYQLEKEGQSLPAREDDSQLQPLDQPTKLVSLTTPGQEVVIAQGGFGGRGNSAFKSSRQTTPLVAEFGSPGEIRAVRLELKLLADIGLVGFPSAGKSTLLSVLTQARPKIAAYPFTTLEPHLGIFRFNDQERVIADLPGIIAQAHQGKGLGLRFLKHIEHTRMLVFVLALADSLVLDATRSDQFKAKAIWTQFQTLLGELQAYNPSLMERKHLVLLNKIDLKPEASWYPLARQRFAQAGEELLLISAKTKAGLTQLVRRLLD